MSYNVFVSYSTKDLTVVNKFRAMLQQTGIEVFVAEYSVQPGSDLSVEINRAIANCDLFVLLWSSHSRESGWVISEVAKAQANGKRIIPVLMEEGLKLPVFLAQLKYFDAHRDPEAALKWLQQNVFNRAQEHQRTQGLAWLGLGAALIWLLSD